MSILDAASGPTARQSSGPVQFSALRDPVYDETTGRTYQLVKRDSDSVPHCVSSVGNVTDALAALNSARKLTHERNALSDEKSAAAAKRRDEIKTTLAALRKVSVERTDRAARMMLVYSGRGID